jgi:hypothetical protein
MLVNCSFVLDTETGEAEGIEIAGKDFADLSQREKMVINLMSDAIFDYHFDIDEMMSDLQEGDCISPMCPGEDWVCEGCTEYQAYVKEND